MNYITTFLGVSVCIIFSFLQLLIFQFILKMQYVANYFFYTIVGLLVLNVIIVFLKLHYDYIQDLKKIHSKKLNKKIIK